MRTGTRTLLLLLWIAATLPTMFLGYGSDPDAWLIARTAGDMWSQGRYIVSRTSGFPLFELLAMPSVLVGQWYLSNLFVQLSGIVLVLALFALDERFHFRHPVAAIIAIAFSPLVIKNAASTMDYIPALALLLWAYVALLRRRDVLAAVLVGVATGFRPTSALFLIPVLLYLFNERRGMKRILQCAVTGVAVAALAYAPALFAQGIPATFAAASLPPSTRMLIAGYNGLQLFGVAGWAAILLAVALALRRKHREEGPSLPPSVRRFHAIVIILWSLLFLVLPDEEEYLLPILPSVVMLLDRFLGTRAFTAVVVVLLLFHLGRIELLGGESGARRATCTIAPGYTIADIRDRIFKLSVRDALHRTRVKEPTVLFYGDLWIPARNDDWTLDAPDGLIAHTRTPLYLSAPRTDCRDLRRLRACGYRLLVWKHDKWAFERSGTCDWRALVEVIDRLEDVVGAPLAGAPLSVH